MEETIKVVADTPYGYAIINAEDFDADTHVRYFEQPAEEAPKRRGRPAKDAND